MTIRCILKFAIAAWLALAPAAFAAQVFDPAGDDTDIFLVNPNEEDVIPNILIVLDNTANWNQEFTTEKSQLVSLVNGLGDGFNVGLMMFPETGNPNDNVDGGYVKFHVRRMTNENKTALSTIVNNLDRLKDQGNNNTVGLAFYEAYLYFKGLASVASFGKIKTDFAGNVAGNPVAAALPGLHALNANPTSASLYNSPLAGTSGCPPSVIIYISNGPANESANQRAWLQARLATLTGQNPPDEISLASYGAIGQQGNWADEMARYMANNDIAPPIGTQTLITYVIEVDPQTTGQGNDMTALMKSVALSGKGKYYSVPPNSTTELVTALESIFQEVQSINSAFASSSLPVSVNVRGTNLNQVYLGVFRPDPNKLPRWPGNLKLYNLALDTTTTPNSVYLADATNGPPPAKGVAAEDPITGFVKDSAKSFWTTSSTYWAFRDANQNGAGGVSDSPDGNQVEKGGTMQGIRLQFPLAEGTTPKRKVYTCINCTTSGTALSTMLFDTTNASITQAALGVASDTDRTSLINWVRGEDNKDNENLDCTASPYFPCTGTNNVPRITDIRAFHHGDVLHSRPAVLNYNRYGSDNDVYVFYGSNAGAIHAVKGGYATDASDPSALPAGREAWSFVPPEFFGNLKRLRDNSPTLSSTNKKPYFADGSIGILTQDTNNNLKLGDAGDIANIYISMRRGGRFLYALDVNDPLNPKFLWTISNATSGFSELGQTWSEPKVVKGLTGMSTTPVLIFGAGYDAAVEDIQPCLVDSASATSVVRKAVGTGTVRYNSDGDCTISNATGGTTTFNRTMGRGIYVVNALTGAKIWSAGPAGSGHTLTVSGMDFAIPSDVTVVKNESGGPINRAYVGDTGGNVWRIDFAGTNLADSTVTKLAAVGELSTAGGRRKFLYPPDVVAATGYDAVLIGSGDREHPFDATATHRMYMFKDLGTDTGPITGTGGANPTLVESALTNLTSNCLQVAADCVGSETQANVRTALDNSSGWFITFGAGEKSVGGQVTLAGTVFFNTNQPSPTAPGSCSGNLGIARIYQISATDATATVENDGVTGLTTADRTLVLAGGGNPPSPVYVIVMLDGAPQEVVLSGLHVANLPVGVTRNARRMKAWYKDID